MVWCGWRWLCLEVQGDDGRRGVNVPDGFDIRLQVQTKPIVRSGLVVDDRRILVKMGAGWNVPS